MITTAPCVGSRKTPPGKRAGYAEAMPPYSPTAADRAQRRAFAALLALPEATKRRVAGRPLVIDDGALDVDIQVGLKILSRTAGPELEERTVASARAVIEQESWLFAGRPSRVGEVRDLTVPTRGGGVPARLYRPAGVPAGPLPLLIWFHGGGWVVGSIDSHDHVARAFCARAEVAVLNVGYRLAPEHPFPAGVEDAIDSFRWSHATAAELGVDPTRIALAGDSAGSNLAAVVSWVTTRDGGVSAPPYDSFNLGDHVGDDPGAVAANRARLARHLGLPDDHVVWMEQTHSTTVTVVDGPQSTPVPASDGLVTAVPGLALAVLTADCVPILLGDEQAGVIAAVHAGRWPRMTELRGRVLPVALARYLEWIERLVRG